MNEKELIINKINKANNDINEIWNSIKLENIKEIKAAWNSDLCEKYIEKYNNLDDIISQINTKLNDVKATIENNN